LLVPAVLETGIVGVVQTLLFALGVVQEPARPAVEVLGIHALLFHRVDGVAVNLVHAQLLEDRFGPWGPKSGHILPVEPGISTACAGVFPKRYAAGRATSAAISASSAR